MKKLLLLFIALACLKAEDIVVVISNDLAVSELSKAQIKRLFLAKSSQIDNIRVKIVELENTSYKEHFYKEVSGKSKAQLRSYWTTLIYTGKAQPPRQLENMQELLKRMREDKKIITYLPVSKITKDMKVLYTMSD